MTKFQLKIFFKATYERIIIFLTFFIISLDFFQLEFLPKKQIIQVNLISHLMGFLIILIAGIFILNPIQDLGINLSPFPRTIIKGNLITNIIYRYMHHPIYYSLILISFCVFLTKLSIYYACLTIIFALIIKFKIISEDQYLNTKFKNYFIYKNEVKY